VEATTPPLDLYLNRAVAKFEDRIEATRKKQLLRDAYRKATAVISKAKAIRRRGRSFAPSAIPAKGSAAQLKEDVVLAWVKATTADEAIREGWEDRSERVA
jgi:hypothetical protein